jgi:outer membrane protein OmpU
MNKLKKIGVSALAGALVSFSANAAEWNVSGQAGITMSNTNEKIGTSTFSQDDAITVSASGQTESGLNISAKFNLEDKGNGMDEKNVAIGMDGFGTLTFHGHGGSPVMGQFDDITPKAYEEVWDVTNDGNVASSDTVDASSSRINGIGETNNLFTYDSPVISGVQFKASYATQSSAAALSDAGGNDTTGSDSKYWDWGIKIAPEMVEGLTLYYAQGERDINTVTTGQDAEEHTIGLTYTYGPITVGYQESEEDRSSVATDNELEQFSIAYAITDDLTVSYGEREFDHDTSATGDGNEVQKDTGYGVSYTMGGVSIGASFNSSDNIGGDTAAANDVDGYEMNVSFAF